MEIPCSEGEDKAATTVGTVSKRGTQKHSYEKGGDGCCREQGGLAVDVVGAISVQIMVRRRWGDGAITHVDGRASASKMSPPTPLRGPA
jgi:hypothetical protein